jgi:multidrug efflux pump subunit AcrA (membrane-fusion protein)
MIARRFVIASAVALIAAAGLGYGAAQLVEGRSAPPVSQEEGGAHEEHGEPGFVPLKIADAAAAGVSVVTPGRGGGADILLPGRVTLAANALAALGAPVSGTVERVHVSAGASVAAGSPIATLRSADAASGRASLDAAGAGVRAAKAAAGRDRRLFEAGVVARQDWEASQAAAEKAQADYRAAQAQVRAMGGPGANGVTVLRSSYRWDRDADRGSGRRFPGSRRSGRGDRRSEPRRIRLRRPGRGGRRHPARAGGSRPDCRRQGGAGHHQRRGARRVRRQHRHGASHAVGQDGARRIRRLGAGDDRAAPSSERRRRSSCPARPCKPSRAGQWCSWSRRRASAPSPSRRAASRRAPLRSCAA